MEVKAKFVSCNAPNVINKGGKMKTVKCVELGGRLPTIQETGSCIPLALTVRSAIFATNVYRILS